MKAFFQIRGYARSIVTVLTLSVSIPLVASSQTSPLADKKLEKIQLFAESAKMNATTTEIAVDERMKTGKGASLKANIIPALKNERVEADLVFQVKAANPGRFVMRTLARTNPEGVKLLKNAKSKFESLFIKIQIDENRPTNRVVYVPWDVPLQTSGKFELTGKPQTLKIWLPRGVNLDYVEFSTFVAPVAPEKAITYVPTIVPPESHPRLWVNKETLPKVKAGLLAPENAAAWAEIRKSALFPYTFKFDPTVETNYSEALEIAAERKAFYYLMTGDERVGREAVKLMDEYLANVEFGNILDVTRELGRAIYTGSEVYDWCYYLMDANQKKRLSESLMRLADDMEIGWPPFLEPIVYGHGNEAQICRDLLSMSIAIYDENPTPYKYTSYAVLEQLVPFRKFQYESGRHNQGVNYGAYRLGWDLHAATLFSKMTGKEVFDSNIKNVNNQMLYMRTPDGQMLRDGDGFNSPRNGKPYYWGPALPLLMAYSYGADPALKADFQKVGGLPSNPVLFLLLNDTNLKPAENRDYLPLTKDFGHVLGGMVARTGWKFGDDSDDVVAEIKGGGYQFANHQHSDAGSIQLYYRGFHLGDIGLYKFYGTPYDMNFNKRSVAHSMMLTIDPKEKFGTIESNDGGTKSLRVNPETEAEVVNDPAFHNGKVVSSDFGPSKLKPFYSYFSLDLKSAYSAKIEQYDRRFCFLNMGRTDVPAIIILTDDITSADPTFKKYWQINTLMKPQVQDKQITLFAKHGDRLGKTYVNMLLPASADRTTEVLSGADATSVFGYKYEVPDATLPESTANRTMISPIKPQKTNRFLTVFQVTNGRSTALPVEHFTTTVSDVVTIDNRLVSMPKGNTLINQSFEIAVPQGQKLYQIVLNGLKEGNWKVENATDNQKFNVKVAAGKNTIFFTAKPGDFKISPGADAKLKFQKVDENLMPK